MTDAPFPPFPALPNEVADHLAAVTGDDAVLDGPMPWDLGALPEDLATPVFTWLDQVCRWLNTTYAWQPHHVIPPCWRQHPHLAYEIAALAFARTDAHREPGSTVIWHEQYERFLHRTHTTLGKPGDQCRTGHHDPRPARYHLTAWPPGPTAHSPDA